MTGNRTIQQAAADAYAAKQFFEFLTGRSGYAFPSPFPQVDLPTDWASAIPAIFELYKEDEKVKNAYELAIRQILHGPAGDVWCGGNVLYVQKGWEMSGKAPFSVDKALSAELRKRIKEKQDDLQRIYPYGQESWSAFEDLLRLQHNFILDWGARLF